MITSAGRSICTPSGYAKASSGEYAGGSCSGVVNLVVFVLVSTPATALAALDDEDEDEANACK